MDLEEEDEDAHQMRHVPREPEHVHLRSRISISAVPSSDPTAPGLQIDRLRAQTLTLTLDSPWDSAPIVYTEWGVSCVGGEEEARERTTLEVETGRIQQYPIRSSFGSEFYPLCFFFFFSFFCLITKKKFLIF